MTAPLTPVSVAPAAPGDQLPPTEPPKPPKRPWRRGVFRWRGVFPLLVLLLLAAVGYSMFADPIARDTLSEVSTKALGTQVDVAALRILEAETAIEMDGIQVADPFDPMRNLLEVGGLRVELERDALLQKKAVIRRLTIRKVRAGTRRTVAARPVQGGGFAPQAMRAVQAWRRQFDIPKLKLAELDTVRSLVLDPRQLGTVKVARSRSATRSSSSCARYA